MDVVSFFIEVVTISASGALAPGPLTAAAVQEGLSGEGWRSGFMMALGHSVVELPVIVALAFGLAGVLNRPLFRTFAGAAGGTILLVLGILQLKSAREATLAEKPLKEHAGRSFSIGASLTGLNPFFVAWWLTVGVKLVHDSMKIASRAGPFLLFFLHVWLDYVWLSAVAHASSGGRRLLGDKYYRALLLLLALILLYFGAKFILEALIA